MGKNSFITVYEENKNKINVWEMIFMLQFK